MICNTDGALYVFRRPIIDALLDRGVCVSTLSGASHYIERLRAMGVCATSIEFPRHSVLPLSNLKLFQSMKRVIAEERPDIVHCFTHKAAIFGTIAARMSGVSFVAITVTGLGSVFVNRSVRNMLLQLLLKVQYSIAARLANVVFFQNPDDLREMTRGGIVPIQKAVLTPGSGLDLAKFPRRTRGEQAAAKESLLKEGLPSGTSLTVLLPARATAEKGVFEFYRAAMTLNEEAPGKYTFIHIGLIDETGRGALTLDQLQALAARSGVRYLGFKEDVERYLLGADMVVLPSHREGLPRSLIEALSYGKVIIASDAPGCRETVLDGENGFLAKVGDAESLAACIRRVTPDLISAAEIVSRRLVEAKFDAKKVVNETLRAYGLEGPDHEVPLL